MSQPTTRNAARAVGRLLQRGGRSRARYALSEASRGTRHGIENHSARSQRWYSEATSASQKPSPSLEEDFMSDSDSDDGEEEEMPWKTLLELPARAAWRSSDPHPPEAVLEAQRRVLDAGGASAKQVRQTYVRLVAQHRSLSERRERERRRLVNGTFYSKRARRRDEEILPVFYGRIETLSFVKARLRPNYAVTKRVLEEARSLLVGHDKNGFRPKRIIDMGIGVGCASAAALEVFEKDVEWVHGIDPSRCMRECSKSFLEEIMQDMVTKTTVQGKPNPRINPPRLTLGGSIVTETSESSTSTFDLALMTYTATELPTVHAAMAAAGVLWQKLAPNGVLVLIEPGTPDGFNTIRAVRNMLLDCCPPDNDDAAVDQCHVIAPCTHNGKCPMERHQHDFFKQKNPQTQMDYNATMQDANESDGEEEEEYEEFDLDFDEEEESGDSWEQFDFESLDAGTPKMGPSDMSDNTKLMKGRFCSFVQTMSSGRTGGEKFSYLVLQKRGGKEQDKDSDSDSSDSDNQHNDKGGSFQNERLRDLLIDVYNANEEWGSNNEAGDRRQVQDLFEKAQKLESKYLDAEEDDLGLEFLQGDVNRRSHGRIIRAPSKKRGHVYIDYCAAPGRLMRSRITKSLDYGVAPGLYTAARKSRWGGLWPDVAPPPPEEEEDEDLDF